MVSVGRTISPDSMDYNEQSPKPAFGSVNSAEARRTARTFELMRIPAWRDWLPPTVLLLIGSCFALSLAQRAILVAGRPVTGSVSAMVGFDFLLWGLWL